MSHLFFDLPASRGFLLAGGAALTAQHLTTRPTQDLDFFTFPGGGRVDAARDEFEAALKGRGQAVRRVRDAETFCRLLVSGPEELLVDLAMDSTPAGPAMASVAGPTFALPELAGRKVVALFDRAEARDFTDVYALARRFSTGDLLEQAHLVDWGFDEEVFAQMLGTLSRFTDQDLPIRSQDVDEVRAFFTQWAISLAGDTRK